MKFEVICCIILALIHQQCDGFLLTEIKQKLKAFLNEKTQSQNAVFPSEFGLEYPGNDLQVQWEIQQLWQKYYACLKKKYESLGPQKSVMPEAIMVFEGSSVRLDCKACISPATMNRNEDVTWFYSSIPPSGMVMVEYGDHVLLSQDKALHMYNLKRENSGQYLCKVGHTVMAPYFLEVVNDNEPTVKVRPPTTPKGLQSQPPEVIPGHDLLVFTAWETWSPCSKCGEVGKRVRIGICTVKLLQDGFLESNATDLTNMLGGETETLITINATSQTTPSNLATRAIQTGERQTMRILTLFQKGIPCRSSLLPPGLRTIPKICQRKSEVMFAFCKEPCPGANIFELLDEKGNVLEIANNSAGIYSTLQGVPLLPPPVKRTTLYEDTNTYKVTIRCPGNLNTDKPVQWKIGTKTINTAWIERQSGGRIYIDMKNHINLKRPQPPDSNIYSCWQGKELAGTVTLIVTRRAALNFNHHIMLFGIVIITGSLVVVCYRVLKGKKKAVLAT